MSNGAFFESSQEIVKKFLNNVVAVDDKLFFGKQVETPSTAAEDDFDITEDDSSGIGAVDTPAIAHAKTTSNKLDHELDYQDLNLAFAKNGINCSAFIPRHTGVNPIEDAATQIMHSVQRADITILDWSMDHDFGATPGTLAKTSIKKILEQDQSQQGRLRLIAIYTAESDRLGIANQIRSFLTHQGGSGIQATGDGCKITFSNSNLEFCKIVVIEKKVSAEDLQKEVIELFTELTIGLLPNATLSALGELRDKTHHILHTFNKDLDSAYLSHVLGLLSSPKVREKADEVALDYAIELISEEFKSITQINPPLKSSLKIERIKDWLAHVNVNNDDDFFQISIDRGTAVGTNTNRITKLMEAKSEDDINSILTSEPAILKVKDLKKFEKKRIDFTLKTGRQDSHEKLSIIECKRRDVRSISNSEYLPSIKLGSIVKDFSGKYYICLQPLCDSVRLSSPTNFLFLEVTQVDNTKNFTHVIHSLDSEKIKLKIDSKAAHIRSFILKNDNASGTAKVNLLKGDYVIELHSTNTESAKNEENSHTQLLWIGELKSHVAQAISHNLAANISRVGLDTNEWLRLSSSNH